MKIYSDWQWWLFVALAFVYGLGVMVTVIVFLMKSAQEQSKREGRSSEIDR
ncbi:MAG: hypothetical protein L0229_21735 [Blastocatellia bacterium]|nr:hypothetical protein [Blastocatellia bacterium]